MSGDRSRGALVLLVVAAGAFGAWGVWAARGRVEVSAAPAVTATTARPPSTSPAPAPAHFPAASRHEIESISFAAWLLGRRGSAPARTGGSRPSR